MEKDQVSGLIPEIYYDLIARVAAGVPLVLIIFSQNRAFFKSINLNVTDGTFFTLVIGLGYLVGHFLATISVGLNWIIWRPRVVRWTLRLIKLEYGFEATVRPREIMTEIYHRIDLVALKNRSGGVVLKKMEAACALTDNLFSAWLLLVLHMIFVGPIDLGFRVGIVSAIFILLFLCLSMWIRRAFLIARQDSFMRLLNTELGRESESS
ncbi:MAG TPA: hypothetical protein VN838_00695 [Bradyrhizobium sp.]|nr:hypothetical protein [Bradyrhizobium sp.]